MEPTPVVLAVDIGNTSIHVGRFRGRTLTRHASMPTSLGRSPEILRRKFSLLGAAEHAIICSVVPSATPGVIAALRSAGVHAQVVGRHIRVPLKNRYRRPEQVGQDRLVGAYAALREFKTDCIVCDFGTAVTIDVVRAGRPGEYLGGIIAPGLELSLETLADRTALLPRVDLRAPAELLGRDTVNSIRSGIVHGCAALCDGLVARLKRLLARNTVVIATGGAAPLIARHAHSIRHVRPNLVLDGLVRLGTMDLTHHEEDARTP